MATLNFYYLRQEAAGQQPAAGTGRPANGGGRRQKPAGAGGARGGTPGEATGAREREECGRWTQGGVPSFEGVYRGLWGRCAVGAGGKR